MADYRGGDRHRSIYGEELIKAIREGRTERQRSRNFNEKLVFAGAQAGLQGIRAGIGYSDSKDKADAARRSDLKDYVGTPAPDYKPMAASPTDAKVPEWLSSNGAKSGDRTELAIDNDVIAATKPDKQLANPYDDTASESLTAKSAEVAQPRVTWGAPAPVSSQMDEEDPTKPKVTWGTGRGMMGSQ